MLARLKNLFGNLAVYGVGDVATSIVSLLLLPVYTRYLTPSDYGVLALLVTIEAVAKITFRWGVDTAFMRLYYDHDDDEGRQLLASTIFFFLLAVNGICVIGSGVAAGWLSGVLFQTPRHGILIALTVFNTFLGGFFFIPLQVLRIGQQPGQFVRVTFVRSTGTLVLRLVLVIAAGMGVAGIVVADLVMTFVATLMLLRWFAPLVRPVFSRRVLREVLSFGLPRIPHSLANQVIAMADRYFLNAFASLRDVGLYSIGVTFGLAPKLFLGALEFAWTPFFLGVMREPDAKRIYSTTSTYILAVLTLLVAGISAIAPDLVRLATATQFHSAAVVVPWIALGVICQGCYLVGSIGIIITKKTNLYPLATGCAAAVSLLVNGLLVPRYGLMGAAWANPIAYGTLAAVTVSFSYRKYPIPYEWGRLTKVAAAGVAAWALPTAFVPSTIAPLLGFFVRGVLATAVFLAVLYASRFFHAGEFKALRELRKRVLERRGSQATS